MSLPVCKTALRLGQVGGFAASEHKTNKFLHFFDTLRWRRAPADKGLSPQNLFLNQWAVSGNVPHGLCQGRRILKPVFEFQSLETPEMPNIAGNKRCVRTQGGCRDQHVGVIYAISFLFK